MAFKRLGELLKTPKHNGILTVRATTAYLARERDGSTLTAIITEATEVLTTSRERREHFKTADRIWLSNKLGEWRRGAHLVRIATQNNPLEVITCDACLMLTIGGVPYIVSTFRDITPTGWVIPGGCPNSLGELEKPRGVAFRELREEVLIGDMEGNVYTFSLPPDEPLGELFHKVTGCVPKNIKQLAAGLIVPKREECKWADASQFFLQASLPKPFDTCTPDVFVDVDPEIASVSLTLYYNVTLPPSLRMQDVLLYDGEMLPDGTPLRRPMRLTKIDGTCVALFVQGKYLPVTGDWITEASARQTAITLV